MSGPANGPASVPTDLAELRAEVRSWCRDHIPPDWRAAQTGVGDDEFVAFQKAWFAELRAAGYAVPHWPAEWGGGMSAAEQVVLYQELAAAPDPAVPGSKYRVHFPRHLELPYFKQLVAERVKITFKAGRPRREWQANGRRNEALDTFVGAVAVRHSLSLNYAARLAARNQSSGDDLGTRFEALAGLFKRG